MSEKIVGVGEEETQSYVTLLPCSTSLKSICHMGSQLKEINYMGLSDCSSVDSSTGLNASEENSIACTLNLKATELTLGLPGLPESPKRGTDLCPLSSTKLDEKLLFPLHPSEDGRFPVLSKTVVAGNKRGFSDAMDGSSEGKFLNSCPVKEASSSQPLKMEEVLAQNIAHESSLAPKAQVVGWPPIKSLRKSTLASTSKTNEEVDGKPGSTVLLIKVSMDGAPYLRKVDLRNYFSYQELSSALENMFSCFTIGECGSHGAPGKESLSESKLKDLFRGSEYVLTYEDKDGDWMLVGDVPWELFINTCKRLRIMKSSDAIGLGMHRFSNTQFYNVGPPLIDAS